jgi:hypothetical protein
MQDKLKKLMDKKKAEEGHMSEPEKHAKMSVLHELKRQASDAMAAGLHHLKHAGHELEGMSHMHDDLGNQPGMKHVSVTSDSEEGLTHGLDKAKEIVDSANSPEPHDPLKGMIHPDDIAETQDDDGDGDESSGQNYGDEGISEHSSEDTEDDSDSDHDGYKPDHDEAGEYEGMDHEALNKKLEHLMHLKKKMSKGSK